MPLIQYYRIIPPVLPNDFGGIGKQMLSVAFAAVRLGVLEILRIFSRTPNLHISKRFARATGVGLGERKMHLRRDAPATKSSGYPRPQAEPRRGRKRLRRRVA